MVSDIPTRDGEIIYPFLQCVVCWSQYISNITHYNCIGKNKYLWFRALTGLLETPADGSTSADLSSTTGEDTPEVIMREIRDQRQEIQTALGFRTLSVLRYSYFNK